MDELLYERVQQLKTIDERLEIIEKLTHKGVSDPTVWRHIKTLRFEIKDMIRVAEIDHSNF